MKKRYLLLVSMIFLSVLFAYGASNFALITPSDKTWTTDTTPTLSINVTFNETGPYSCELFVDGVGYNESVIENRTLETIIPNTTLSQAAHQFYFNCTDSVKMTKSAVRTLYVDDTNPSVTTLNYPTNNTYVKASITFNFTSTDNLDTNLSYKLWLNQKSNETGYTQINSAPVLFTVAGSAFTNGAKFNWSIEVWDDAGKRANFTGLYYFTVDTVAPSANLDLGLNNTWTTDNTPTLSFNITDNYNSSNSYIVFVDSVAVSSGTVYNDTQLTPTLAALSSGTHRIFVYSTDKAGNTDNSSVLVLKVDNAVPTSVVTSPLNHTWTADQTPEINFTLTDDADTLINYTVYVDGTPYNRSTVANNTPTVITLTTAAFTNGNHTIRVEALDNVDRRTNSSAILLMVDAANPTANLKLTANNTWTTDVTPDITFNITDNLDAVLNYTIFVDSVARNKSILANNTPMTLTLATLSSGTHRIFVYSIDQAGNVDNSSILILNVDYVAPIFESAASINSPDIYFAAGDVLNVSVNFTDATSSVQNITFNLSQVCNGVLTTRTSRSGGVYWANCTVDKNQNFQSRNLTYTSCDIAGNCGTGLLTTVVLYNFTRPGDSLPLMSFDSSLTTDLSNEDDLENVSWQLGININGDLLPGQPWSGLRLAAFLNFSSINFTDQDTQQALAGLMTAMNITIRDPRDGAYGGSRIYIDSTAFAELDTVTDIELYGLPFADVDTEDLLNDTGGNGGITDIVFESNGDGTGNLSFTVLGFSGYNVTDLADPVIDVNLPLNSTYVSSFRFNATFNGTGTEIDNSSINITIGAYYFSYENLTCTYTNNREVLNCAATLPVANGVYNFTVSVDDFGGSSGNTDTYSGFFVTVDNTIPAATITTLASWTTDTTPDVSFNLSDNVDLLINYTIFVDGVANRRGAAAPGASTVTLLAVSEANHTVKVEAMDSNGNRQNSSLINLIVDNTNPASNLRLTSNNTWTTDSTPTVYFNMTDNLDRVLNYTVFVDAVARNRSVVANGTTLGITLATLAEGTHSIKVQAADEAGKRVNSSILVLKVDSINPAITLNLPTNSSNVSDTTVSFNFTGTDNIDTNMSYQFFVNGDLNRSGYTNTNNSDITFSVGSFDDSTEYNWTVEVTDNAGNRVNATVKYFTVDDTTALSTYPVLRTGNVTDTDSDGNIELVWAADSNAAYYRVYRNTSNITDATNLDELDTVTGASFEDNTTVNGTTYWYVITSLDASQNEDKTVVSESFYAVANDSVMPNLGSNLNASTNANGGVFVSWDAVLLDVSGNADLNPTYRVFRTTNLSALNTSSSEEIIANTTGLNYTDTNMTTGTNYTYVITSVDDGLNHNSSKASYKVIVPAECTTSYTYGSWSSCVSSEKTRTGTRTCYGGGNTTITETASCTSSSGGGGSSSSSSSAGSSLTTSNDPTAIRLWMGLSEGTETKMTIQDERFSVTEILVRIAGAVSSMQMTVQDIQTRPSQLPEVADKAFKYFKIDKTAQDSAIGSAVIKFRVEKKWLSENGLDKSTVALERYVTKWVKLATKLLSEDDDFVYYEAESPGFSYFAVTAKVPGTVTEPVPEVIVPSVEPPTPEVKEEAPPAAEEKVPQKPKEDKPNVLLLVLVAVLIIIAGYLLYKKPKAHEHDLDKIAKELDDLKKKKH